MQTMIDVPVMCFFKVSNAFKIAHLSVHWWWSQVKAGCFFEFPRS